MIFKIFTSYDEKAQAYLTPFYLPKTAQAIRHFADSINNPETQLYLHPSDYSLFCIGTFDDESGELKYEKKSLGNGVEFLNRNPDPIPGEMALADMELQSVKS